MSQALTTAAGGHCIIPWAFANAAGAQQALKRLALPRLDALLATLTLTHTLSGDELTPTPPHEQVLARALGLPHEPGQTPWAAAQAAPSDPADAAWAWLTPCHWMVGADQVVMGHPQALMLSDADSRALLAVLQPFFAEDGITLHYEHPLRWRACGEVFRSLTTASLDRVIGRNVDPWLPRADEARLLRRLQSETQMLLYTHPLTEERQAQGRPPVNAFWVSGAGALPAGWQAPDREPEVHDALREPALQDDWDAWSQAWQALDAGPLAKLLSRLQAGEPVQLTLCGERHAQTWSRAPRSVWQKIQSRFGRKPASSVLELL